MQTIHSDLLHRQQGILHTFTTRHHGVSREPYLSNNIAFHVGDDEHAVRHNQAALAKTMGYDLDRLTHMRQVHSDQIIIIDETYTFDKPPECDALITDLIDRPLMVMTADCTPILLYDHNRRIIAAIHAGRAGAFKDIVTKTITKMQKSFQSDPADIIAVLGPSIGVCCYEVDKKIDDEASGLGLGYAIRRDKERYLLDVNAIIRRQLLKVGISASNLEEIDRCSSCHNDTLFSYRADGKRTGRMAALIGLTP